MTESQFNGICKKGGIKAECTPEQSLELVALIVGLEAFPTDGDRVRFVYSDGTKGKWFSRRWQRLNYNQVR